MKKLILSLLACGTVAAAQAQMGLLLYGTGTYTSSRGSNDLTTGGITTTTDLGRSVQYQIAPGIGWSIDKNIAIGIDFNFTGSKTDLPEPNNAVGNAYETKSYSLGVGPFVRYTKMLGEHFFVFGQFTAHYNRGNDRTFLRPNVEQETTFSGFDASIVPAVGVRVSPTVGLSFGVGGIGFQYANTDNFSGAGVDNINKESAFGVTFGQQFNITLQKYCNWAPRSRHRHDSEMDEMDNTRRMDKDNDE